MGDEIIDEAGDQAMSGGVNRVTRRGDTVARPQGPHSKAVHSVLTHFAAKGIERVPQVISTHTDTETLTFLHGETTDYPLAEHFRTDQALISAARLLRALHDATVDYVADPNAVWGLEPRQPAEVICHGDFAPFNCVINGGEVTGVFDWDTAHPGPRIWDVAYAAYRWVPLTHPDNPDGFGTLDEQRRRLMMFCVAYGRPSPADVLITLIDRLAVLVRDIARFADQGIAAFQQHIAEGHIETYRRDAEYVATHQGSLVGQTAPHE